MRMRSTASTPRPRGVITLMGGGITFDALDPTDSTGPMWRTGIGKWAREDVLAAEALRRTRGYVTDHPWAYVAAPRRAYARACETLGDSFAAP